MVARYLIEAGKRVTVLLLCSPEDLKGDAKVNFDRIKKAEINPVIISIPKALNSQLDFGIQNRDLIVDAILGTGISKEVTGVYREAIQWMNASGKPIVSVDIPSGLDADTGKVLGAAVKACYTGALGFAKQGLLTAQGPDHCGALHIIDIGFPPELF